MKKLFLVMAIGGVLVLSGLLLASNMGFKLNYDLTNSGTVGTNWISLPYFYISGTATSEDLCDDIGSPCDVAGNCIIGRFLEASDAYETWSCQNAKATPFTLTEGQAVYVKVNAPATFTIVGSHDPAFSVGMTNGGTVGTNWISVPYHTTAVTSEDLCDQIGSPCDVAGNCIVGRFLEAGDAYETWSCQNAKATPFNLTRGQGVYVKVNAPASFTPAHY